MKRKSKKRWALTFKVIILVVVALFVYKHKDNISNFIYEHRPPLSKVDMFKELTYEQPNTRIEKSGLQDKGSCSRKHHYLW